MLSFPGKIPIRIFPFFWVLTFMIGWLSSGTIIGTCLWAIVIVISVLIHEFGHALTALAFGQHAEIDLVGFGGLTRRSGSKIQLWKEFLVVFNGPFAGLLLFLVVEWVSSFFPEARFPLLAYSLGAAAYVNLVWSLLNLLPVQPLDGGHLVRIILEALFGFKGVKLSFLVSIILAGLLSIFFFINEFLLAGALFLMMAFESYRAWSDIRPLTSQDRDTQWQELFQEAQSDLKEGRRNEAFSKLLSLREHVQKGILYVASTELLSQLLMEQKQYKQAYEWLKPLTSRLSTAGLILLQQLAYRLEEWEEVAKVGTLAYRQEATAEVAFINALACAIMGQSKPAVGWLRGAMQLGMPLKAFLGKREFDAIRNSSEFRALTNESSVETG